MLAHPFHRLGEARAYGVDAPREGVGAAGQERLFAEELDLLLDPLELGVDLRTRCRVREITLDELGRARGALYYDPAGRLIEQRAGLVVLAFATVAGSWLFVQMMFALHYAHEFFAEDEDEQSHRAGLLFPGDESPDYWDFLHFAAVLGVAGQTADVAFASKSMRRTGTVHGMVAFIFNTVVLALTIYLLAGLF